MLKAVMDWPVSRRPLEVAAWRVAAMFGVFTLLRAWFLFHNRDIFEHESAVNTLTAFFHGLRFDASSILTLNAAMLTLAMLPLPGALTSHAAWKKGMLLLTFVCNLPAVALEWIDAEYFRFQGHRSTLALTDISADIGRELPHLMAHYWPVVAGLLVVTVLLWMLLARVGRIPEDAPRTVRLLPWGLFCVLLVTPVTAAGIRGAVTGRMLAPPHAFLTDSALVGSLTLNTTFCMMRTEPGGTVPRAAFFNTWPEVLDHLGRPQTLHHFPPSRQNVVVIIMESISTEHLGIPNGATNFMPFLRSLAARGVFFDNNFANGRRSVEGATSILGGIPSMMEEPYISSRYQANNVHGLGQFLKRAGYNTHFLHGGFNGSMYFDSVATLFGLDRYVGKNEYPHPEHYDGDWGIYDHHFLEFFRQDLATLKPPFLSVVFTLSSHPPFLLPPEFKGRFPKGTREIHELVGYLDMALQDFFTQAEQAPWYSNTLFVITGDHTTEQLEHPANRHSLGQHAVPLIFFDPSGKLTPRLSHRITQHTDIIPSVVDYLGLDVDPGELLPFGHSVFDEPSQGLAINREPGETWMATEGRLVQVRDEGDVKVTPLPSHLELEDRPPQHTDVQLGTQLKAFVQFYRNGLNDNSFYPR